MHEVLSGGPHTYMRMTSCSGQSVLSSCMTACPVELGHIESAAGRLQSDTMRQNLSTGTTCSIRLLLFPRCCAFRVQGATSRSCHDVRCSCHRRSARLPICWTCCSPRGCTCPSRSSAHTRPGTASWVPADQEPPLPSSHRCWCPAAVTAL